LGTPAAVLADNGAALSAATYRGGRSTLQTLTGELGVADINLRLRHPNA